jgi:predicted membrane protein
MMLVLFYQVCTGEIEELTERQSYIIGHMAVFCARKTCNFATFFLFDFNKYKSKACSLFLRSINMMLVLFYQVCTGGIEELTERQSYIIGHMAVFCARKTCHFATFFLFDFNKYKSKACSLFLRTINMMLVLFYQVCTGGIEELTERQSYIIGHIDVLGEKKELFKLCGVITSEPQNISSI